MLPILITRHPYFHEDLTIEKAISLLTNTPLNEGNFLFCKTDETNENEYALVCKRTIGKEEEIETYHFVYRADLFGSLDKSQRCLTDNIFSGLHDVLNYVTSMGEVSNRFRSEKIVFSPKPILNKHPNSKLDVESSALPPLPNDIGDIIFQYLDSRSQLAAATVSKSWYSLFNKNLLSVFHNREKLEAIKIKNEQKRRENENMSRLLKRGRSGLSSGFIFE